MDLLELWFSPGELGDWDSHVQRSLDWALRYPGKEYISQISWQLDFDHETKFMSLSKL